ncbi:hypothetical protein EDB83DRAFT_1598328 [Lactarius deliciosus]|nr:hypothetical protein EDB83DRAFT_1598328 [Lactarius deliciosus]
MPPHRHAHTSRRTRRSSRRSHSCGVSTGIRSARWMQRGFAARILAKRPSWHLLEKRVANVRSRAVADGRLRRPAFEVGLRMQPSMDEVRLREHAYDFDPYWRSARRAHVCKLLKSFEITSGEVVWGQLAAFVSGMKSGSPGSGQSRPGLLVTMAFSNGSTARHMAHRALSTAAPTPFSQSQPTGFLLHHETVDPTSVLVRARCGDAGAPCVGPHQRRRLGRLRTTAT